jgi:ketosteroid isomerase-like protein
MLPDVRVVPFRIEAQTEHLLAMLYGGHGTAADGGELEIALGAIWEVRDGRVVRQEAFAPDDREGLMRRFGELARERELEQTVIGRLHLEYMRSFNERDWERYRQLFHEDCVAVDHRRVAGWDAENADQLIATMRAWAEMSPDARTFNLRVDALTPHLIAGAMVGRGKVDGAEFELAFGIVWEERDGRLARIEGFEPEDRDAIMRRFEELVRRGELEQTIIGRVQLDYMSAFNDRDWAGLRAALHDEFVSVDHRRLGWDIQDAQQITEMLMSWAELSADARLASPEIHAYAEHLLAGLFLGSGTVDGADFEVALGFVVKERDGRFVWQELFDPDDRDGIMRCFEELAGRGTEVDTPVVHTVRRYIDTMRRRDWPALTDCFTPDFLFVDRRQLGWGEFDRDAMIATSVSAGDVGDFDVTVRVLAAHDDAVAYVLRWTGTSNEGAAWENIMGSLNVGHDAFAYGELFDPDDEEALLARFAEVTADGVRPVHPLVRVTTEQFVRSFNERRWDDFRPSIADDYSGRDLRRISEADIHGPDAHIAQLKGIVAVAPDVQMISDVLAGERLPGGVLLSAEIVAYSAHLPDAEAGDGLRFGSPLGVTRVVRDAKLWRIDILEDDPDAVLAHYDALKVELLAEPSAAAGAPLAP